MRFNDQLKVVFTIASLAPSFGGPSRTVPQLCVALVNNSLDLTLVALHERKSEVPVTNWPFDLTLIETRGTRYLPFGWARGFKQTIQGLIESARVTNQMILHDNGVWLPTNHLVARIARRFAVPLVVSPRGMLTAWAMRTGGLKKCVAWSLYQRRDLQQARVLHATSSAEAEQFRKLGLKPPVAVIPNGIEVPSEYKTPSPQSSIFNASRPRTLLFLSRIHPVKGLTDLVRAWAQVRPKGWRVVIAGPSENGHQAEIETLVFELGVNKDFEFIGSVADEKKWNLYGSADLFVLPSYSENFGLVIAEALACGLPVITTKATPWEGLEQQRCGWWIGTGVEPLADALREAIALGDTERREMGSRGRRLVETHYTWKAAARQMASVYYWVLGQAERPACLV